MFFIVCKAFSNWISLIWIAYQEFLLNFSLRVKWTLEIYILNKKFLYLNFNLQLQFFYLSFGGEKKNWNAFDWISSLILKRNSISNNLLFYLLLELYVNKHNIDLMGEFDFRKQNQLSPVNFITQILFWYNIRCSEVFLSFLLLSLLVLFVSLINFHLKRKFVSRYSCIVLTQKIRSYISDDFWCRCSHRRCYLKKVF